MTLHHAALAALAAGLAVFVFLLGVTVYVFASYALMLAHTEKKPWKTLLREALTELRWAAVTQPLLPLYYLIGRDLGGRGGKRPVVFVHGYMQNRVGFIGLARALRRRGFGPLYGFNYPWFLSIRDNAKRLVSFIDETIRATGASEVDLVCHSMGGLVALEALRQAGARARVRACVTIATPHAGVVWKGPIPGYCGPELRSEGEYLRALVNEGLSVKVLSIFSTHDNVVHPPKSSMLSARGGRDVSIAGGGHFALLFSPEVTNEVASFLEQAEVAPPALGRPEVEHRVVPEPREEGPREEGPREEDPVEVEASDHAPGPSAAAGSALI